jgi:predicted lipoprotein with Yx(FWY)xxD motif
MRMETRQHNVARLSPGRRVLVSALLLGALTLFAAAHASASGNVVKVAVAQTAVGSVLVNGQGRTLYMFALDTHGKSACYSTCAHYWPPLLTSGKAVAGTGAKASLLGTTRRKGGGLQVTYNGHPLYRYISDTKAGQTSGQGLNISGGLWWAISRTGALDKRKASSGGGGGGYG